MSVFLFCALTFYLGCLPVPGLRCIAQKVVSAIISLYPEIAIFRRQPASDFRTDLYALPAEVKAAWGLLGAIAGITFDPQWLAGHGRVLYDKSWSTCCSFSAWFKPR